MCIGIKSFLLYISISILKKYQYLYSFRVETIDGSATEGNDYIKVDEILTFQPNETEKEVKN